MNKQGIIGAVILAVGGMCPLVHVPILGNWNYFGIDAALGFVFYFIVAIAFLSAYINKPGLIRISGYAALVWVVLTLLAVWFKSHDYFHFIHFKKLINLAAGMVKYKWGWFVIIAGAVLLIVTPKKLIKPLTMSAV
jgi:hypothetical protein